LFFISIASVEIL